MFSKLFINSSLFYLDISGCSTEKLTTFRIIRRITVVTLLTVVLTFMALDVIINWNGLETFVDGATGLSAFAQVLAKIFFIIFYRQKFNVILNELEKFWPDDVVENNIQYQISSVYQSARKLLITLRTSFFLTLSSYFGEILFAKTRSFPVKIYHPVDLFVTPYFEITYLLIFINSVLSTLLMLGYDSLYIALVAHVICELKKLRHKFASLKINLNIKGDEEKCLHEFSELVGHHCFVLGFIKLLSEVYSLYLLCLFLTTTFGICLALFNLSGQGFPPKMDVLAQCVSFLSSFCGELLIYCAGGNIIAMETSSISDAVYESHWWVKTQPKLRKAMVLVILRSQKGEIITAGGMFQLNLESFTQVVRTGLSVFTLMHAVYTKEVEVQ